MVSAWVSRKRLTTRLSKVIAAAGPEKRMGFLKPIPGPAAAGPLFTGVTLLN